MRRRLVKRIATILGGIGAAFAVREVPELAGMESDVAELATGAVILAGSMLVPLESRAPKDEVE